MNWDQAIKSVAPHIVKIENPSGYGTGFLAFYNYDKTWCGIATAAHVVSHADEWQEPIKITHTESDAPLFLDSGAAGHLARPQHRFSDCVFSQRRS